jgi:ABC-2 type transport system ATP-binding protein
VGLDPPGRLQLLDLIRDLRDEGRRVLLSTHILQDAEHVCDEILLLEGGAVAFAGPIGELVGGDRGRMVAVGEGLDAAFADALAGRGLEIVSSDGGRLVFRENGGDLLAFWGLAAERGAQVRYLARDLPSLEEAVVAVMERGTRAR